jgi:hypothetical protein
MKKIFFAVALMTFVGTIASTAYAASNGVSKEIKKDDKKKKRKKKDAACCSGEQEKAAAGSCAKPGTEGKSCCKKEKN